MDISQMMDVTLLREMVDNRYVNAQQHPSEPYTIYNYSHRTQYEAAWNEVTRQCRGLIVANDGTVIARPFAKFFNLSELETIPDGPFVAQEKMDGSLGVIYALSDGTPVVATRGSFASVQAAWATGWLHSHENCLRAAAHMLAEGVTPLVEIIYPSNRIVVDYGNKNDLTLLTTIDISSGRDVEIGAVWPGPHAATYTGLDLVMVTSTQRENAEGFVLRWDDGTRAKIKHDEYIRLHRLLTGVTARTIWEMLANRMTLDKLVEVVPDEFYEWVRSTERDLKVAFSNVEREALTVLDAVPRDATRREQAEIITTSKYPGIVFSMLDQKDYAQKIWGLIKPAATRPFRSEDE